MKKIKILVVGLGFWGKRWVATLLKREDYEITGVVTRDKNRLKVVGKEFNFPEIALYTDYRSAIKQSGCDSVGVVVPSDVHLPVIESALEAGKHVLLEKPLAGNMKDALKIGQLLKKHPEVVFMVNQTRRWQDHIHTLKKCIEKGMIGKPQIINISHMQSVDMGGYRAEFPFPVIDDMAIHHFDMIRYITGCEPVSVFAKSFNPSWSWYDTKPASNVLISMTDGLEVNYFGTWVTRGKVSTWEGNIIVTGEKGTLEVVDQKTIYFYPASAHERNCPEPSEMERRRVPIKKIKSHEIDAGLDRFAKCIRDRSKPETSFTDNIKSFAMVCAAAGSCRKKRIIEISEILPGYPDEYCSDLISRGLM